MILVRVLFLALLSLWGASPVEAAAAFVQSKSAQAATSSATIAVTLTSTVASGGAVAGCVVAARNDLATPAVSTILDDKSNSYTPVSSIGDGINGAVTISFYALNITNAPQTITVTFTAATDFRTIAVTEASGVATSNALDQSTGQAQDVAGTGTDATTSGAVTTTSAGQFVFGCSVNTEEAFGSFTAGTGFTSRENLSGAYPFAATEDLVQGAAGSIAATFTMSGGRRSTTEIMTFKAAGGGGGGAGSRLQLMGVGR